MLYIFYSKDDMIEAAADKFAELASEGIEQRGRFTVALSGGSTPEPLYELLAERDDIEWSRVHIFFGDERTVPPDNDDSNYRMACLTLLDDIDAHVYRIKGELDPAQAANDYINSLQAGFAGEMPRFDLMLQGMGKDGHTASLFPNTAGLDEQEAWVVANHVPQLDTWRITMTYPVINNAHVVMFLIAGEEKADALYEVLKGEPNPQVYPAQAVEPLDGELLWYVDRAAAQKIKS
ncbi:MAG: 6-phosphogluconolactonase [Chloroflexi bacterium]|nr:6-phosphogluconolactonase [Chloroflexota bacterium]